MACISLNNDRPIRWRGSTASASLSLGRLQGFFIRLFEAVGAWQDRAAERRRLAWFDDRMLHDIGLDRASAQSETSKWFWQE